MGVTLLVYGVTMALNIKNEQVHALAREAARRTGMSQTSVLEAALRRYLDTLEDVPASRADRVRALVREFNAALSEDDRTAMRRAAQELYDADGLPR